MSPDEVIAAITTKESEPSRFLIPTLFLARLAIDIDRWSIFALLPAIRQVFFVPEASVGLVVTAQAIPSLIAPALGGVSDVRGRKSMLTTGLSILAISMVIIAIAPNFSILLLARFMVGLASIIIIPNLIAYLGDKVIYSERGRAVSVVQASWPVAAILGTPFMAFVLHSLGWSWPFILLATIASLALTAIQFTMPANAQVEEKTTRAWITQVRQVAQNPVMWTVMVIALMAAGAVNATFTFYSIWLVNTFHLDIVRVGWTSSLSGLGSLGGILIAGVVCDRIGKKSTMVIGFSLAALCLASISWLSTTVYLPLLIAFLFAVGYDMAFVGYYAFLPELLPDSRGLATSFGSSMLALGSIAGSMSAGLLWPVGGFSLVSMASSLMLFVSAILVYKFVVEHPRYS